MGLFRFLKYLGVPRPIARFVVGRKISRWKPIGRTIEGIAWVTDGDGIKVNGHEIRINGIDAPEFDQPATFYSGKTINHGGLVKSVLIKKVGGKPVTVKVQGYDKYGRVLGEVYCDGDDIGAWLVESGNAIAAYSEKYKHLQRDASRNRRGMWGFNKFHDPRVWRNRRNTRKI